MLTHEELTKTLYEAYRLQAKDMDMVMRPWDEQSIAIKKCWSAVADAAWEHVEGENAQWAQSSQSELQDMRSLIVEFMHKAEDVLR